jgi:hypothetical protein
MILSPYDNCHGAVIGQSGQLSEANRASKRIATAKRSAFTNDN